MKYLHFGSNKNFQFYSPVLVMHLSRFFYPCDENEWLPDSINYQKVASGYSVTLQRGNNWKKLLELRLHLAPHRLSMLWNPQISQNLYNFKDLDYIVEIQKALIAKPIPLAVAFCNHSSFSEEVNRFQLSKAHMSPHLWFCCAGTGPHNIFICLLSLLGPLNHNHTVAFVIIFCVRFGSWVLQTTRALRFPSSRGQPS